MRVRWKAAVEAFAFLAGVALIAGSVWMLEQAATGVEVSNANVGPTPVTVHRPADGSAGPAVVIAHGFAGSRQIMQSFSLSLARAGYTAVSFDFSGHGRHPEPMRGDLHDAAGATRNLLDELERVIAYARTLVPEERRIALVGHSMATDIVIRAAGRDPDVVAMVAVSMSSPALSAAVPRNLLVVVGDWESEWLKGEALRAVSMVAGADVEPGGTHGDRADGTARRAVFAEGVEHVGVLFAAETMRETVAWIDAAFDRQSSEAAVARGPWIALLMAGVALMAWPLCRLLPRVRDFPTGAAASWRSVLFVAAVPAILTPLILWRIPTDFLAMIIGDYLVVHLALYGLIAAVALEITGARTPWGMPSVRVVFASLLAMAFGVAAMAVPLDRYFSSFVPTGERAALAGLLTVGALAYFVVDDWITRGRHLAWAKLAVTRILLLASLGGAIALDAATPGGGELFFLIVLLPMIAVFFLVFGALSAVVYARTGHPGPGALMSAAALGWAVAVTFPILAGA